LTNNFILLDFSKQCLQEVLEIVLDKIGDKEADLREKLLDYAKDNEQPFCEWNIPWPELKLVLELIGRNDIVKHLQETTLLTPGIYIHVVL